MSPSQRMRVWGAGVAAGHVVLALVVSGSEQFFGLCALMTLALSQFVAPLLRPRRDDGGGDWPPTPGDEPPPPWWPEFERDFRAYSEGRERTPNA